MKIGEWAGRRPIFKQTVHREYSRKVTLKAHSKQIRVLAGSAVPIGGIPEAARAVALGAGP